MAEDRQALLNHFRKGREEMRAAIAGLSDEQMVAPVLDGWSLKDHLAHLAFWDDIRADEVNRISLGHETAWKMSGEQDAALNEMAYELRKNLPLAQVRWEWEHSRERLLKAIEGASERGLRAELYGEAGLTSTHEQQHAGWIREHRARW